MDDTGIDRCPVCWSPVEGSTQWVLLSHHRTSEGDIEYCQAACGCMAVLCGGELLKSIPADSKRELADNRRVRVHPAP
jgi:hypothetical protein